MRMPSHGHIQGQQKDLVMTLKMMIIIIKK